MNTQQEINDIIQNFIIYATGSNNELQKTLELTLDDYQEVMKEEGCGLEHCPFKKEEV